jgi:hypothetical protein
MVIMGLGAVALLGFWTWGLLWIRRLSWTIANAWPGDALIERLTVKPCVSSGTPVRLTLLVSPANGTPYRAEIEHFAPDELVKKLMPGVRVNVLIDPGNPQRVLPDWDQLKPRPSGAEISVDNSVRDEMTYTLLPPDAAADADWDPNAIGSGAIAAVTEISPHLLRTGKRAVAYVLKAARVPQKVGDLDPSADPAHARDPIWLFKARLELADRKKAVAVFGHWVPAEKEAEIKPGIVLCVHVDPQNMTRAVALDWDEPVFDITGE